MKVPLTSVKLQFRETSVTVRALDEAVTYSAGVKWDAALLSRVSVGGTQRGWKLVLSTGTSSNGVPGRGLKKFNGTSCGSSSASWPANSAR